MAGSETLMNDTLSPAAPPVQLTRIDKGLMELADKLGASNWFGVNSPEQAYVKVLCGAELGLSPVASMMGIHVVEGKPMLSYTVMASMLRRHPTYDYEVIESTRERCEIEFTRLVGGEAKALGRYSLTMQQAVEQRLALKKTGGLKANYERHPDAMLFARCLSQGCRFFCPDAFMGGVPMYAEAMGESELERDAQAVEVRSTEPATVAQPVAEPVWDEVEAEAQAHAEQAMEAAEAHAEETHADTVPE